MRHAARGADMMHVHRDEQRSKHTDSDSARRVACALLVYKETRGRLLWNRQRDRN
jgi:hypothetical protein